VRRGAARVLGLRPARAGAPKRRRSRRGGTTVVSGDVRSAAGLDRDGRRAPGLDGDRRRAAVLDRRRAAVTCGVWRGPGAVRANAATGGAIGAAPWNGVGKRPWRATPQGRDDG